MSKVSILKVDCNITFRNQKEVRTEFITWGQPVLRLEAHRQPVGLPRVQTRVVQPEQEQRPDEKGIGRKAHNFSHK